MADLGLVGSPASVFWNRAYTRIPKNCIPHQPTETVFGSSVKGSEMPVKNWKWTLDSLSGQKNALLTLSREESAAECMYRSNFKCPVKSLTRGTQPLEKTWISSDFRFPVNVSLTSSIKFNFVHSYWPLKRGWKSKKKWPGLQIQVGGHSGGPWHRNQIKPWRYQFAPRSLSGIFATEKVSNAAEFGNTRSGSACCSLLPCRFAYAWRPEQFFPALSHFVASRVSFRIFLPHQKQAQLTSWKCSRKSGTA